MSVKRAGYDVGHSARERHRHFRPLNSLDVLPKIVPPQKSGTISVRGLSRDRFDSSGGIPCPTPSTSTNGISAAAGFAKPSAPHDVNGAKAPRRPLMRHPPACC